MNELQKIKISDGINLYYTKDDKYKTVSVSMYLHRPVSREEVTKNSLLAGILRSGTGTYPSMREINRYLESLYGTVYDVAVSRKGAVQSICASFSVVDEKIAGENVLNDVIELMFEFIFNPACENGAFIEKYVDTEKKNLKDSIEALVNDKRSYASFRCLEEMCRGEKAGISEYGYVDDLPSLNSKNLYEHYKNIVTSSPVDIFVTGVCDIDAVKVKIKEGIGKYDFDIKPLSVEEEEKREVEVKNIEENFDVAQGKLVMGLRTFTDFKDDLYYPLLVGNSIFGSGTHSKLFNNVREKSSLAYYVSSRLDKFSGVMLIGSGIEFKNFERAKSEILKELDDVKKGIFNEEDLSVSKDFLTNQFRSYLDSPYLMNNFCLGQILYGYSITVDEAIEKVQNVTKEQIIEAFGRIKLDTVYFLNGRE